MKEELAEEEEEEEEEGNEAEADDDNDDDEGERGCRGGRRLDVQGGGNEDSGDKGK